MANFALIILPDKTTRMKKLVSLFILSAVMVSCNSSNQDVHGADSAVRAAADTIRATADTAIRKIDSGIKAIADTATSKIKATEEKIKEKVKN
jgi:hypothetical protein